MKVQANIRIDLTWAVPRKWIYWLATASVFDSKYTGGGMKEIQHTTAGSLPIIGKNRFGQRG
jgi:hypothetical protein